MKFVQISSTFESHSAAKSLAARLVEEHLVGCAQVEGPIESTFRWKGEVARQPEWRMVAKTRADMFDRVAAFITELHDYDVPQIVATELKYVTDSYGAWLSEQTDQGKT